MTYGENGERGGEGEPPPEADEGPEEPELEEEDEGPEEPEVDEDDEGPEEPELEEEDEGPEEPELDEEDEGERVKRLEFIEKVENGEKAKEDPEEVSQEHAEERDEREQPDGERNESFSEGSENKEESKVEGKQELPDESADKVEMEFADFKDRISQINQMGYVDSHREGSGGIGKTLEDLLGIKENNIAGPDFSIYELKSGRKSSTSMLTLFSHAPEPEGVNGTLLEEYGYPARKEGISEKELHVTVDSIKPNSVGLQLSVEGNRLYIANNSRVKAYYEEATLKQAFEAKYHKLVYVLADNQFSRKKEQFWYNEAYLLDGFSFERFSELVKEGVVKVDIRIGHYPNGRVHDHGTGFRILPKYLPRCFENIQKIL